MKHQDRVSVQEFIRFASAIAHQNKLIQDAVTKGNCVDASVETDYLEVIVCDWLRDLCSVSSKQFQTHENCAKEIVANDLAPDCYDGLTITASIKMHERIKQTLSRFYQ